MSEKLNYWTRKLISRRAALRGGVAVSGGLAALSLVGCSNDNKDSSAGSTPGSNSTAIPSNTTAPASDPSKGIPGGDLVVQTSSYHGGLSLVSRRTGGGTGIGSLAHQGLLRFKYGVPGVDPADVSVEPDLATALPEQPDDSTYIYKLHPSKFQNGRAVTSEDVKYTYERYAFSPDSVRPVDWFWLDSVEAPDPETVVVKTKGPYADALQAMAAYWDGFILAKEFEESTESASKVMGSGPYLFDVDTPPISTKMRRNPDYFQQPYPFFDTITVLGDTDPAKRVADFSAKNVHMTYWFTEEPRDEIVRNRPDAVVWSYAKPAVQMFLRTDQPPLNDKRVRQALNMTIDRQRIREAVSKGEGKDDQVFSIANNNNVFNFTEPADLGDAANYWKHDPQAALQLLSAAGVSAPISFQLFHPDAGGAGGQAMPDTCTLAGTHWKDLGIATVEDVPQTTPQFFSSTGIGNYDGAGATYGLEFVSVGKFIRDNFWAPPDGTITVPTSNPGFVANATLSQLLDKQLTQLNVEDRRSTFKEAEQIMAEEMYRVVFSTYTATFFTDPSLKNAQVGKYAYAGTYNYMQFWWFDA
jgi:ABC-type transport system substrate-binding protein